MSWGTTPGGGNGKAVVTFKGGKVHIDLDGFKDAGCAKVMDKLTANMKIKKHLDKPEFMVPEETEQNDLFN